MEEPIYAISTPDNKWVCWDTEHMCPYVDANFTNAELFQFFEAARQFRKFWEFNREEYSCEIMVIISKPEGI